MMKPLLAAVVLVAACSKPPPRITMPPPVTVPPPVATPVTEAPPPACGAPEYRQFDFWHGRWDVTVRARATADGPWGEAKGTQHIESILGGCATAEHFAAEGPGTPWAGKSFSSWQPAIGKWRQTWVDDQGSYIALTGGIEDGAMTLYGEPRIQGDVTSQNRMRFVDVTATSLHWIWESTVDGGATWTAMMEIDYKKKS